jgi:hypothetical protein
LLLQMREQLSQLLHADRNQRGSRDHGAAASARTETPSVRFGGGDIDLRLLQTPANARLSQRKSQPKHRRRHGPGPAVPTTRFAMIKTGFALADGKHAAIAPQASNRGAFVRLRRGRPEGHIECHDFECRIFGVCDRIADQPPMVRGRRWQSEPAKPPSAGHSNRLRLPEALDGFAQYRAASIPRRPAGAANDRRIAQRRDPPR